MASFFTEGRTMTHSARSSKSFGMSSGMLRISFRTTPASFTRSISFSFAAASASGTQTDARKNAISFFMIVLICRNAPILLSASSANEALPRGSGIRNDKARRLANFADGDPLNAPFVTWRTRAGRLNSGQQLVYAPRVFGKLRASNRRR